MTIISSISSEKLQHTKQNNCLSVLTKFHNFLDEKYLEDVEIITQIVQVIQIQPDLKNLTEIQTENLIKLHG